MQEDQPLNLNDPPCWRSLTTISTCQLRSKIGEINIFISHMLMLLTKFHLYSEIYALQNTKLKTSGKYAK
jgi:hypothetical protein